MKSILLIGVAAGAALATASNETAPVTPDETGVIEGMVSFDGDRPDPLPPLSIGETEAKGCCPPGVEVDKTDRSLLIDEKGGICNVVVTLTAKDFERPAPEPVVLDQKHCRFEPSVVVVPVGAELKFHNSDEVNHNIHTYAKKNKALNNNVASGSVASQTLDKDEEFEVKCDIHPWMLSNVYVTEATHWGVSGLDGKFRIEGVPPGTYKLEYWHGRLGKGKTEEITVTGGATATADIQMGEKKKKRR